ncbi:MAG: hypothetical protein ABW186_06500 [Rhodanobacteraceae bacterium]
MANPPDRTRRFGLRRCANLRGVPVTRSWGAHIDVTTPPAQAAGERFERALALLAAALVVAALALYLANGFRDRLSSDAAVSLLLARHMLETHTLVPGDWYYGNGDLWILGPQIVALPFVALWGATPFALACGNALGLVVIFACAFVLARAAGGRWPVAVIAGCVTIALYSHFQREFVVEQLSYGWMSAKLMLLVAAAVFRLRNPERARLDAVAMSYVVLLCVWTAENPVRPLLYFVLPFGAVLLLHRARGSRALAVSTVIGLAAGWLLRRLLLARVEMVPGLESFHFVSPGAWMHHLGLLIAGLRQLYGAEALGAAGIPLIEGPSALLRALCLPAIAVAVVLRRIASTPIDRRPLETGALDLVLIAFVLIAGSTLVDPLSARYLIPAWHLALVGFVIAVQALPRRNWIVALLVIAFPLGGLFNAIDIARAHSSVDAAGFPHPPPLDGLIEALRASGLKRGFATHRHANAATVRSAGEVVICDARFGPTPQPLRWLNERACFAPATYDEGFFFVLGPGEIDAAREASMRATLGEPANVISVDGYAIWTYPKGTGRRDWLSR